MTLRLVHFTIALVSAVGCLWGAIFVNSHHNWERTLLALLALALAVVADRQYLAIRKEMHHDPLPPRRHRPAR